LLSHFSRCKISNFPRNAYIFKLKKHKNQKKRSFLYAEKTEKTSCPNVPFSLQNGLKKGDLLPLRMAQNSPNVSLAENNAKMRGFANRLTDKRLSIHGVYGEPPR